MATLKVLQCREHGGNFSITPRRGRPPVRCTEDNPCDMNPAANSRTRNVGVTTKPSRVEKTASAIKNKRMAERQVPAQKATRTRPEAGPVTVRHNPSVVKARQAKERLEPLGWECKGRAWFDDDYPLGSAEVTATRDTETIILHWHGGKLVSQNYLVWDGDKAPAANGKPRSRLPFDPNELTDSELIKAISGQKVTWWNRIASATENAIIPGDKIQIEHTYSGTGDESLRIVKFVDLGQGGFRAFHVEAMMKVG